MPPADAEGKVTLERFGVGVTLDKADASVLTEDVPRTAGRSRPAGRRDAQAPHGSRGAAGWSPVPTSPPPATSRRCSSPRLTDVAGGQAPDRLRDRRARPRHPSSTRCSQPLLTGPARRASSSRRDPTIVVRPLALRGSGVTGRGHAGWQRERADRAARSAAARDRERCRRPRRAAPQRGDRRTRLRPGGVLVPSTAGRAAPGSRAAGTSWSSRSGEAVPHPGA